VADAGNEEEVVLVPRQEINFTVTKHTDGKIRLRLIDRINVDDVYLHHINRQIYRQITGDDPGDEVNPLFKQFLLKERFIVGQR